MNEDAVNKFLKTCEYYFNEFSRLKDSTERTFRA